MRIILKIAAFPFALACSVLAAVVALAAGMSKRTLGGAGRALSDLCPVRVVYPGQRSRRPTHAGHRRISSSRWACWPTLSPMGLVPLLALCGVLYLDKKMKESCLNCKHKAGCLQRSTTIFMLFIATGRDEMVPEAQKNMNIRASCNRWAPAERTE